jgi:hypothetical protein
VLGTRERGIVEVTSGLKAGDLVVTDGVLKLRPNMPVRPTVKPLEEQPSGDGGDARLAAEAGLADKAGLSQ